MSRRSIQAAPPAPAPQAPGGIFPQAAAAVWAAAVFGLVELALTGSAALDRGAAVGLAVILGVLAVALARLWTSGRLAVLDPGRAVLLGLPALFFMLAVQASAGPLSLATSTIGLYLAANIAAALLVVGPKGGPREPLDGPDGRERWALALGATLALACFLPWLRGWANLHWRSPAASDALFLFFVDRRSALDGIAGAGIPSWSQALGPLYYFALLLGLVWALWRRPAGTATHSILALLACGLVLGKLQLDSVSGAGLGAAAQKIQSVHTAYYNLVDRLRPMGAWNFVTHFNSLQGTLSTHGETHPFGPELFYWLLRKVLGSRPDRIGFAIMLLTALTVVPVWKLAESVHGTAGAGLAAALLYVTSPMALIMSESGIDCVLALGLALTLWQLDKAAVAGRWQRALAAGALFFGCSLLSGGSLLFGMFCVLWVAWRCLGPLPRDWRKGLLVALGFGGAFLVLHGLLWAATGGAFSYLKTLQAAMPAQAQLSSVRPYAVWAILDPFLFAGYAGIAVVGLFAIRAGRSFWRLDRGDAFTLMASAYLATLAFASLGNAEVQRLFQYAQLLLLVPAAGWLLRKGGRGRELDLNLALAMAGLNLLGTLVLQMHVADYW